MATTHKVGGEIDASCGRCKMVLAHTILAMVGSKPARVRCNTCGSDHAYRGTTPAATKPRAPRASKAAAAEEKVVLSFQDQLAGRDLSKAKNYSPRETFVADDLVSHPTFGIGIVTAVRVDKVDISFKGTQKTLIHGRAGGTPAEKPHYSPPHAQAAGPADKPLPPGEEPHATPIATAEAPETDRDA